MQAGRTSTSIAAAAEFLSARGAGDRDVPAYSAGMADIHGNILALEAVLADLARRGGADLSSISATACPARCGHAKPMERLEELGWPTVRGNHDRRVALDPPQKWDRRTNSPMTG